MQLKVQENACFTGAQRLEITGICQYVVDLVARKTRILLKYTD
jgi:hypothetical protein